MVSPGIRAENVVHATSLHATSSGHKGNSKTRLLHGQALLRLRAGYQTGTNAQADSLRYSLLTLIPDRAKPSILFCAEISREEFMKTRTVLPHLRRLHLTTTLNKE
jgi:hypothetical protein